jgi:hypothetical protein
MCLYTQSYLALQQKDQKTKTPSASTHRLAKTERRSPGTVDEFCEKKVTTLLPSPLQIPHASLKVVGVRWMRLIQTEDRQCTIRGRILSLRIVSAAHKQDESEEPKEWSRRMDDTGSKSRWVEMAVKLALAFAALFPVYALFYVTFPGSLVAVYLISAILLAAFAPWEDLKKKFLS